MRSSLDSPIYGLDDIYDNKVVTIRYRDPTYPDGFIFEAKRLPGAIEPPNVLAPEQRSSNYRPQIGFNRDFPQASLGDAGHRMVNHHSGGYKQHRQQQQQQGYSSDNRNFASIPPPNNYRQSKFISFSCSVFSFTSVLSTCTRIKCSLYKKTVCKLLRLRRILQEIVNG